MTPMECTEVSGRLPWLARGTLEASEERSVRQHLATCGACRRELADTHAAWAVISGHLPAEALVQFGFEEPQSPALRAEVDSHLRACADCANEMSHIRRSRALLEEAGSPEAAPAARHPPPTEWWRALWAAGLVAALAAGLWQWREARRWRVRFETLASERGQARETPASPAVVPREPALEVPRLNVPLFELVPHDPGLALRSGQEAAPNVLLVGNEPVVTLVLLSVPQPISRPHSLALRDEGGRVLWQASGLRPRPEGDFVVALPVGGLPSRFTLRVQPEDRTGPALDYPVRVQRR
jgi:hypothetical protein